jgi:hypothetical protein
MPDLSPVAWWLIRHTAGSVLIVDHDEATAMARLLEDVGVEATIEWEVDSLHNRGEPFDSVILGNLASHPRPDLILDAALGVVRSEGCVVVDASPGAAAEDHIAWERLQPVLEAQVDVGDIGDGLDADDRPWLAFAAARQAEPDSQAASKLAHREFRVVQASARKKATQLNVGFETSREISRRANAHGRQLGGLNEHLRRLSAQQRALTLENRLVRDAARRFGGELAAELRRMDRRLESQAAGIEQEAARVAEAAIDSTQHLRDLESRLGVVSGVVGGLAGRLAAAESELERVRFGLERMKSRRGFRLAAALADDLRSPRRWWRLPVDLVRALKRRPAPEAPGPRHTPVEYLPADTTIPAVDPPLGPTRYPHLRIAHWGRIATFDQVATHLPIDTIDYDEELGIGFDFVLLEPSVVDPAIPETITAAVAAARDAAIPTMMFLRSAKHLDLPCVADITTFLTEDPTLGKLAAGRYPDRDVIDLTPSIDPAVFNPIEWQRQPDHGLITVTTKKLDNQTATLVASLGAATLATPPGITIKDATPLPDSPHDTATFYKTHLAALVSPNLATSIPASQQHLLELAATGTPIITTDSGPLHGLLDPDHYLTATTPTELAAAITHLDDRLTRERLSIRTRRHVLTHHTRLQRLEQILTHLDIPTRPPDRISILLATNRPDFIEQAIANVTNQTHPDKELILILHGDHFDPATVAAATTDLPYPTTVLPCPGTWTLGDCLNHGLDHATGTYITKMDDDDYYGPNHLTDTLLAHTYTNAHITGKWGNIVYLQGRDITIDWRVDREEQFGNHLPGATMLMARDLLTEFRFNRVSRAVDSTLLARAKRREAVRYSTNRFNFIRVRHGDHTFQRDDDEFITYSTGDTRPGMDTATADV